MYQNFNKYLYLNYYYYVFLTVILYQWCLKETETIENNKIVGLVFMKKYTSRKKLKMDINLKGNIIVKTEHML